MSPVLLLIDEFGKNLEEAAESALADPYILQKLAEAGSGDAQPIFLSPSNTYPLEIILLLQVRIPEKRRKFRTIR